MIRHVSAGPSYSSAQNTTPKGPGFWNWFWTDPYEWAPFVINVAGDVASLIDPLVKNVFEGIAGSIVSDGLKASNL